MSGAMGKGFKSGPGTGARRTAKQRAASAANLEKARKAKARGQVPVKSKGRNAPTPVNKTIKQPKSFTGMSAHAGWTPPGLSRTLSPSAIAAIKKRG